MKSKINLLFIVCLILPFSGLKAAPLFTQQYIQLPQTTALIADLIPYDFDDNGIMDFVALNFLWPVPAEDPDVPVTIVTNLGDGNFSMVTDSWVDSLQFISPRDWDINDFDMDGRKDLVIAEQGNDVEPFPGGQNRILIQTTDGKLLDETSNRLPQKNTFTHNITAGDINGDNFPDIYMCNIYGQESIGPSFYMNNGSGVFEDDSTRIPPELNQLDPERFTASTLVDTDNDGDLDLFLGRDGGVLPSATHVDYTRDVLLLNNGSGIFTRAPSSALPVRSGSPTNIVVDINNTDFNNDGRVDLLISTNFDYQTTELQLLINTGNNTFIDLSDNIPQSWPDNSWIRKTIPGDFNNDGKMDFLAVGNGSAGPTKLFFNTGNAVFEDVSAIAGIDDLDFPWEYTDIGWAVSDFTGDGWLDIVALDHNERITLFRSVVSENMPTVTTATISDLGNTSATSGGVVTDDKGIAVTSRGICWSENPNPTIADSTTTNGSGTGAFTSDLTDLYANTTYFVRSWATNIAGMTYGNQITFVTEKGLPRLTTTKVSNISNTMATSGGQVINDGGVEVTSRGVCWSQSSNPSIYDHKTLNGIGTGVFDSHLTNLELNNTYHVRSWATNSFGTAYGNEIFFSTHSPWALFLIPIIAQPRHN